MLRMVCWMMTPESRQQTHFAMPKPKPPKLIGRELVIAPSFG